MNTTRKIMILMTLVALVWGNTASAGEVKRRVLEPGIMALGKDGRTLGLEVKSQGSKTALASYLLKPEEGKSYENRVTSFVPFERLSPKAQRKVILAIFEDDVIDSKGWHHTSIFKGETLWTLCKWGTGSGSTYKQVQAMHENKVSGTLKKGDRIRVPLNLLTDVMKQATPKTLAKVVAKPVIEAVPVTEAMPEIEVSATIARKIDTPAVKKSVVQPAKQPAPSALPVSTTPDLKFKRDAQGDFAGYILKKGETLYSSVVMRFTDYFEHADVLKAAALLARRTAIKDMTDIDAGLEVRIPIEMLSAKFQPKSTQARVAYDESVKESTRLKKAVVKTSKDLSDIVVILDPGHGGEDHGAHYKRSGLYEDEINYDIVMRIKDLLEKETAAKVYVTLKDKSSGYAFNDRTRFSHDKDEMLLTNPHHMNNVDARFSANMRCMLVNKIYDTERRRGVPARKIIFTSLHTESVMNTSHRGTKIFIPGSRYRRSSRTFSGSTYARYEEGKKYNTYSSTTSERKTDEALSRNFANVLMDELGKHRIKRNDGGNAIRGEIRKSRSTVYVPAVLNYTKVPTKILIETANLQNPTDRQRLADPWWRQEYAKAYVAALKRFYSASSSKTSVAQAGR